MNLLREKLRAAGHHLACGGESDSSQRTEQKDMRVSGRDGAQVSGDNNTVHVTATDYGAVMAGQETARSALTAVVLANAVNADVFQSSLGAVKDAYSSARTGEAPAVDQRTLSLGVMGVLGLAAVTLLGKK
jgi:hypothetical protein